jgi:glycine/D-amino acid oxidase-like deaminating enzyme
VIVPAWSTTDELPNRSDIVVVGGGIAGTSAAYHVARSGKEVALLERGAVGSGATSAAVGVLSPPIRQPFHETAHFLGIGPATSLWRFAQRSIEGLAEMLESTGAAEAAELDLSGGYVLAEPHSLHALQHAFNALQHAGLPVEWLTAEEIRSWCSCAHGFSGGYRIRGGGAIAPGQTALAIARAAEAEGARVFENVDVSGVTREGDHFLCAAGNTQIICRTVVYATHTDTRRFSPFLEHEIVPIRGQGFRTGPIPRVFDGSFATHRKLNVWRQDAAGRLLVGGWRHDAWTRAYGKDSPEVDPTLQTDLLRWFESAFPELGPFKVRERWSGVFGWTADFLPLVGPVPGAEGEFVTSGFSGGGLPFAFESGRVIATLISGEDPPEGASLFAPERFSQRAAQSPR